MKKTNNMKKIVIATISFLASNVVLAQSYGGLSYPLPEVLNKKEQKVVELNEIMSSSLVDKKNGPKEEVTEMRNYIEHIKEDLKALKTPEEKIEKLANLGFELRKIFKGINVDIIDRHDPEITIEKVVSKSGEGKISQKEKITISIQSLTGSKYEALDEFFNTLLDSDLGKINAFVTDENQSLATRQMENSPQYEISNPILIKGEYSSSESKNDFTLKDLLSYRFDENPLTITTNLFESKGKEIAVIRKNQLRMMVLQDPAAEDNALKNKEKISLLSSLGTISTQDELKLLKDLGIAYSDENGNPC